LCITVLWRNADAAVGNVMPLTYSEPASCSNYINLNVNPQVITNAKVAPSLNNVGTVSTTIADRFSSPMPILYYPAILGATGVSTALRSSPTGQFAMSDNSAYINASNDPKSTFRTQANFNNYIEDPAYPTNPGTPFRAGGFILVSAGIDGLYGRTDTWTGNWNPGDRFTCDDIRNYNDSRN
jgi:hypothetical protein